VADDRIRGSWMMWRIEYDPIPHGNRLNVSVIGQPGKALGPLMNSMRVIEAGATRFDLILDLVQAEFDPEIDPDQVTRGEMRGEIFTTFFKGYESSLWIDAHPGRVKEWIFSGPQNLEGLIPMVELQGQCADDPHALFSSQRLGYCPARFKEGDASLPASVLGRSVEDGEAEQGSYSHETWIVILDIIVGVKISIQPQAKGSLLKVVASSELPELQTPEAMELFAGISRIPKNAETILLRAKRDLEKPGPHL